jgi:hypothetical protein
MDLNYSMFSFDTCIKLTTVPLGTVMVGPVPMVFEFGVYIGSDANLSLDVNVGIMNNVEVNSTSQVGAQYQDGSWTPVCNWTLGGSANYTFSPTAQITASLTNYCKGSLDAKVLGLAGPTVYLQPYQYNNASFPPFNYELGVGLSAGVGLKVEFISWKLAEYDHTFADYQYPIIHESDNPPNTPSIPSGASSGTTSSCYGFSSSATDPDGDSVAIRCDWGNGDTSSWSSYVSSGSNVYMGYTWSTGGTYSVRAQAKDVHGITSGWSAGHQIVISGGAVWTVYNTSNSSLPNNNVFALTYDGSNIWIGTYGGLAKFDGTKWTVYNTSNSNLPNNYVYSLAYDGSNIWIGTLGGLTKFDGSANWATFDTSNSSLPNNYVYALAYDGSNIWIGTESGLAKFNGSTNWTVYSTSNSGLPYDYIDALAYDGSNIWIGTINGLAKFNGSTNWTVYDTLNSGLPNNNIYAITHTGSNIWIGTWGGGLAKFDGSANWTVYDTLNSGLPYNYVYAVTYDGSNIWAGTWSGGLAKFDGTNWAVYNTSNSSLPSNNVPSLAYDGSNVWIGTYSGLVKYGSTKSVFKSKSSRQMR